MVSLSHRTHWITEKNRDRALQQRWVTMMNTGRSSTTAQAQPAVWSGNFFPFLLFIPAVVPKTPRWSPAFVSLPFEGSGYSSGCPASVEAPLKTWNFSAPFNYRKRKAWFIWSSWQSRNKIQGKTNLKFCFKLNCHQWSKRLQRERKTALNCFPKSCGIGVQGRNQEQKNPNILMFVIALTFCGLYSTGLYIPWLQTDIN